MVMGVLRSPADRAKDVLGRVYEYFLAQFAGRGFDPRPGHRVTSVAVPSLQNQAVLW